jgi:hypothetical protein
MEDIFQPTIGNESLNEISNDNGIRVVNFAISKNLTVKSTMFHIATSPDGKTCKHIGHILINRQSFSVFYVRSFRKPDFDTDHYLVVAKVRERLAVNKQRSH